MREIKLKILNVSVCIVILALVTFSGSTEEPETFLVKGAKIYTSGPKGVLKDASFLVERGKIRRIIQGEDLPKVPVVDYSGKCIVPGFVDAHTYVSGYYRLLENTKIMTSDLMAYPAFNPLSPEVQKAIRAGITTVNLSPRNENLVGGISSVFKLTGKLEDLFFLKKDAFLKVSFNAEAVREERAPTSLMGAEKMLSEAMQKVKESKEKKREEIFQEKGVARLVKGDLSPIVAASSYEEINTALQWLKNWGLKGAVVGGEEAHHFGQELKESGISVLLSPLLFSLPGRIAANAATLLNNGIKIAFVSDMPEADPSSLRISALILYHTPYYAGESQEEAIKTITLFPAQILGIDKSAGSLEEGKDADFVVFSGEPLDLSSKIVAVYSNGQPIFKKDK